MHIRAFFYGVLLLLLPGTAHAHGPGNETGITLIVFVAAVISGILWLFSKKGPKKPATKREKMLKWLLAGVIVLLWALFYTKARVIR